MRCAVLTAIFARRVDTDDVKGFTCEAVDDNVGKRCKHQLTGAILLSLPPTKRKRQKCCGRMEDRAHEL